jgi:hypothetical protein
MNEQITPKDNRSLELCRRVVTTESFIAEAKEIYGERYDYNKVDYKNRDHRVIVTCPVHGDFQVYAREHLDGKGCPKCEKGEKFLAKLKEKFGDKLQKSLAWLRVLLQSSCCFLFLLDYFDVFFDVFV